MTLPIIMEDIRDKGLSLNVVVMATKTKAEPERAEAVPALLFPPNVSVDHVSGEILKRRIEPRLNALENLILPKVTIIAAAKAKALA